MSTSRAQYRRDGGLRAAPARGQLACRQQTLPITRDFNNVVAKKADHFLLLSGTLFDDYESKDEEKKGGGDAFAELKIAIQNHVHVFLVHTVAARSARGSSTPPAHRRRISMQIENQLLTLAKEQGVTADVEAANSQGRRRGSVRNSTVVSFDHLAMKEADDAGKSADEEQPATGRFAKFRDIISRTPADLRELKIYTNSRVRSMVRCPMTCTISPRSS